MTNETEISLEEIKTILSNYKGLKKQIRNHISDLYDDLMDTDNLIETVSIKKTEISEMGTKGGSKKDLSDIIIRHECILKRWYREISYEIESLMKKDEKIRRVWLCYQLISEECYEVVTKIYVEHLFCNHKIFSAWFWTSRRMIMNQNHVNCLVPKRLHKNGPNRNPGTVRCSFRQ